jgi:acyl-CoA thioester hydrolase
MDAFKHLNNCEYFRYQEIARLKYFTTLCTEIKTIDPNNGLGFDEEAFLNATGFGPILSTTECRFKFPVSFPDVLLIGATCSDLEEDRFLLKHTAWSLRHGRIVSEGSGAIVTVDYANGGRKCAIHPALNEGIKSLQMQNSARFFDEFQDTIAAKGFDKSPQNE